MIKDKKFCKKCGQQIDINVIPFLPKQFVELSDGLYCLDCGKLEVNKRRGKKK